MAGGVVYQSLHCRGLSVDQTTGVLRYESAVPYMDVAQFIAPKPLSENCDSFSIEIVNSGWSCRIGIGLCHKKYPSERQPGWDSNSIGYHADNGGIYHETGHSQVKFGSVGEGEVMECSFDFAKRTVSFRRNELEIFTSRSLHIPQGGFYPIIGLHSPNEMVRLLETEPWEPDIGTDSSPAGAVFHALYCRETRVSQRSGIVRYNRRSQNDSVGQFVSKCPLTPECNKFSVEIASLGEKSCISVGVCHRCYPSNCQPGWIPHSIAYHVDDGGIYHGSCDSCAKGPTAQEGDTLSCELDFSTKVLVFRRNGTEIYQSQPLSVPPGGFHAIVGFHSPGEAVCLIERQPWRSQSEEPPEQGSMPKCCMCMDKGVSRFLIPCGHTFCVDCVEERTADHKPCPACRVPVQNVKMLYF